MSNDSFLKLYLKNHGFYKRANGVYVSFEEIKYKNPKYYFSFSSISGLEHVSLKTTEKEVWKKIIEDFKSHYNPEIINRKADSSDTYRKYITDDYKFETYEPIDGIKLAKNDFFEIYLSTNQK